METYYEIISSTDTEMKNLITDSFSTISWFCFISQEYYFVATLQRFFISCDVLDLISHLRELHFLQYLTFHFITAIFLKIFTLRFFENAVSSKVRKTINHTHFELSEFFWNHRTQSLKKCPNARSANNE